MACKKWLYRLIEAEHPSGLVIDTPEKLLLINIVLRAIWDCSSPDQESKRTAKHWIFYGKDKYWTFSLYWIADLLWPNNVQGFVTLVRRQATRELTNSVGWRARLHHLAPQEPPKEEDEKKHGRRKKG